MSVIERFKRDVSKHPARASVLAVLTIAMVALSVRAVFELQPKPVRAGVVSIETDLTKNVSLTDDTEAMDRVGESKRLWPVLREVSGVDETAAFTFDASYYPADPAFRRPTAPVAETVETPKPVPVGPPVDDAEAIKRAKTLAVREQSHSLMVRFTSLGNGNSGPQAVVNGRLLTVGQEISGFEITAIRAREVEFTKDGVTIAVKMADDPRGQ